MKYHPLRMPRAVTLQTIANELGCSAKSVSNAYNRPDQLSAATRERVLEVAARLGYPGPDPVAAGLRRGRVGAVGFAYPNQLSYAFSDPFMSDMLAGIGATLEQSETGLLLIPASAAPERAAASVTSAAIDALIVGSLADDDPLLAVALRRPLPIVVIDEPYPDRLAIVAEGRSVPAYVGIDDRAGARSAAEHLIELGHREIGIVSFGLHRASNDGLASVADRASATFGVTRQRLLGYRDATDAAGIDWSSVVVAAGPSSTVRDGFQRAGAVLDRRPRPTALLCLSDALAEGAIQAAAVRGLVVPDDVSVVGFDDAAPARALGLTSVAQPAFDKGATAARILLSVIAAGASSEPRWLSTELVVRHSSGRAPFHV
jgi:DNA-binding LacI/PurR family transcriptional regulator